MAMGSVFIEQVSASALVAGSGAFTSLQIP
jgi:hypothetical protein